MATAKANHLPDFVLYVIRPALVEARLLTDKHARDPVYVVTLGEELRGIEAKVAAMEETLHLVSQQADPPPAEDVFAPLHDGADANWIRAKSRELDRHLRRIEQSAESGHDAL